MSEQVVVAMGVHVLDVLVRPVTEIPDGQGGVLVEQIKMTAAGSAGGTALVLSRLGAEVRSAGAIGTDALGDSLLALLQRDGIDTTHLLRRDEAQTSASVLPIRPDGSRPAFHVVGANATYTPDDVTDALLDGATHLHLGGPEFLGGEAAAKILARAKDRGITTSADVLAPGDPGILEWIAAALPLLDYFLPNDEQAIGFTGAADLESACRALLERGIGCVAATRGGDGVLVVDADGAIAVPATDVEVVDTTGCGDAFSAGFLRGLALGHDHHEAARLGCATAGIVAGGLGSDHGDYDLTDVGRGDRVSTAVVTGAARGLGFEIAKVLAARGLTVHLTDVDADGVTAAAEKIGGGAFASTLDVRDFAACQAIAAATVERTGDLSVWVNNAGVLFTGPAWEHDDAARRLMMDVNATGTINGTLAALEPMRSTGRGHVVNVVSMAGIVAAPREAVYAASKHAAIAFSLSTLNDLRLAGIKDVDISCLCPDGIWTPMLHDRLLDPDAASSFIGTLLVPEQVAAHVGQLLDRPRPVTTVPKIRGAVARFGDLFPRVMLRLVHGVHADGRRKQRKIARRIAKGTWPPSA